MTKFPDAPPPSRRDESHRPDKSWDLDDKKGHAKEFKTPSKKVPDHEGKISQKPSFDSSKDHRRIPDKKNKEFDMDQEANLSPDRAYKPDQSKTPDRIPDKRDSDFVLPFDKRKEDIGKKNGDRIPDQESKKTENGESKVKNGDSKAKKKDEDKDEEVDARLLQGQVQPTESKVQTTETQEVKTEGVSPSEAAESAKTIRETILRLASSLQTGTVEGKTVQRVELKTTAEVPSFLQGASVQVVREAPGKISVSIGNLTAQNEQIAIRAIESQTAELQKLVRDLAAKQISITELRIGEHAIVPRIEAPAPSPFSSTFESFGERRREQGEGGGRGGGGKGGGEGQKEGREKQ